MLRHVGRRIAGLPAVLVLTYRDDEMGADHPLRPLLGALLASRRLPLAALSRGAVARLAGGTTATSATLFRLTGGNPFFVTEAVAAGPDAVPATVVDAVLARARVLPPEALAALEQLAVVPSGVGLPLARALLDDLSVLAPAERAGLLEVRPDAVAFRHELARRAIDDALPATRRMALHAAVLRALTAGDEPDLARVVHHAAGAGDDPALAEYAPAAARQAAAAGAHRQAAALYGQALRTALPDAERAALLEDLAWTHFHGNDRPGAVRAGTEAVALRERLGDPAALGQALSTLALQQWAALQIDEGLRSVERAVASLRPGGDSFPLAFALTYRAVLLVNLDREREGREAADEALAVGGRLGLAQLRPTGLIYRGRARWQRGDPDGHEDVRAGIALAEELGRLDDVMMGYTNLASLLWRYARYAELEEVLEASRRQADGTEHTTHDRVVRSFGARLAALRGNWADADADLRWGLDGVDGGGMVARQALPTLAQIAVRQGSPEAPELLATAWANAESARALPAMVATAVAEAEQAWLTGRDSLADHARALLAATEGPGREREHAELLRWLHRLGDPVVPFPGCPEEYAAGLRGDWRAAATAWERIGAPYERALELTGSDEAGATLDGLAVLDALGARPAAALVRARLRGMGVHRVPRGPHQATRGNPAGLTGRQLEILRLVAAGLTNAEIAASLVLSVRTVDHHVSAVLQKLGVASRRDAARALAGLETPG
ncbi:LuxR C-terminal-related transcriptional regulator [Pseudonocardia kujensis]|uniref:LuxR C-terminal-related transcriptional regulator n=1 Tax=Pseudonocardia kujensis TaxID=1128675 RepID=UPI001E480F25|nr:LuxR family transcriptional regulator [Pseudonocardia kujensis]MCE0767339.1 LuxR C-terminal-related transcriptional regulator [Pseudonocardia kujensis]